MRIAELTAPHCFRLIEGHPEEPGPGQVQVRVESVGICGSDLHYYGEGAVGDTPCEYPMVLGHEPAGTVLKTGAGVTGWAAGDRAAFEPALYCYHCEFCMTGHHNVCSNLRFMSMPDEPGFFREIVNLPVHNLLPIPPALTADYATLHEPLAVIVNSMKFIALRPAETAVVFGAGPIGLLTVALLRLSGAGRIWAVEPVAHRRELAKVAGADAAIDPRSVDPVREIVTETRQRGVDVAIDCAAKEGTINQCINAARNGGRVVITGIPSATLVPLEFSPMRRKELALYNVRRSNNDSAAAMTLLINHLDRFAPLVTHRRPLEAIDDAFSIAEQYRDGVGKMIVNVAERE